MEVVGSVQDDRSSQDQSAIPSPKLSSSGPCPNSNGVPKEVPSSTPITSPKESSKEGSDPMDPLEAFDWSALEESYHDKMHSFVENEQAIIEEFGAWMRV